MWVITNEKYQRRRACADQLHTHCNAESEMKLAYALSHSVRGSKGLIDGINPAQHAVRKALITECWPIMGCFQIGSTPISEDLLITLLMCHIHDMCEKRPPDAALPVSGMGGSRSKMSRFFTTQVDRKSVV